MAILSGLANGLLLAIINVGAEMASNQQSETRFFFLYLIAFALFVYTLRYALSQAIIAVEDVIRKVRVRVVNKIRSSELLFIESTGRSEIYTRLTQDSNLISQSALIIISAGQAVIVLVFSLIYVALLSPLSFVLTLTSFSMGLLLYFSIEKKLTEELEQANQKEAEFGLFNQVETISNDTEALKVSAGIKMITAIMFSQMAFYLLLAVLIFIVPAFSSTHSEMIFKITATILFIEGPLGMLVAALPMLARTNVAEQPPEFKEIQLEEVIFHYTDKQGKSLFSVGPFNLTIKQGEILFIVGGNGSGKSTLLKVLVGLYYPAVGCLYLDGEEIDHTNYQSYRELYSTIFTDFHLFDRFYGLPAIDEQRVKSLLRLMELEKKTKYIEGKFTNTSLSTGQKKRLAFVGAVLEDKPVYIFDELAADQDPHFRKYFYEVILKDLQKQGKTVIAVTHDDKYFNTADRVLKMEYGNLVNYEHG